MTKRTRVFIGIACGILVIGLGTGLVAAYVGGFQNLVVLGSNGPDELAYIPQDAQMVAYANIRDIMTSELRQKFRDAHPDAPNANEHRFQEETGIDFENDIDYVVASAEGSQRPADQDRPLMLARGRFDRSRIEALVEQHGGTAEDYRGTHVLTQPESRFSVAFVESNLVAAGSPEAVRRAIDTKAGTVPDVKANADIMRLLRQVDSGTAWAIARFDAIGPRITGAVPTQLPPINWVAVTGQIDGGIRGTMHAETRDEASAQNLQDVIRGMMALARLQVGQHAELAAFVDSLQLSGQGAAVTLAFAVPAELLDTLAAKRAAHPAPLPGSSSEPKAPTPPSTPAF
jgi:Protein of unknown function (DUF3352)